MVPLPSLSRVRNARRTYNTNINIIIMIIIIITPPPHHRCHTAFQLVPGLKKDPPQKMPKMPLLNCHSLHHHIYDWFYHLGIILLAHLLAHHVAKLGELNLPGAVCVVLPGKIILMITSKESQQKLKLKNFTKFESLQIPTSLMSSSSAFSVGFIPIALIAHPSSFVLMFPPPSTSNSLKAWKSESESRNLRSRICVFLCIGKKQTNMY